MDVFDDFFYNSVLVEYFDVGTEKYFKRKITDVITINHFPQF